MTVILRDTFTGGDDSDIAGRTPDGGGSGPLAIGTWVDAFSPAGSDKLGITSGVMGPVPGAFNTTFYAITGHGLASADYTVRGQYVSALATDGFAYAYVGFRVDETNGNGYWLEIVDFGAFSWIATLFQVTGGSFTQLDQIFGVDPLPAGTQTLTISGVGTAISATLNSTLAVLGGTDSTYTGIGNPGAGGTNGDPGVMETQFSLVEVDDSAAAPPAAPDPCIAEIARDDFLVAIADITNKPLTAPFTATWEAHPASLGTIRSTAADALAMGAGRAVYLARATGVGPDYCVQVAPRFPLNPGNPGSLPWMERWRYHINGDDGHPIIASKTYVTADGYCDALVTDQDIVGMTVNDFTTWPSGQPKTFSLGAENATVNVAPGSQAVRTIMFYATLHVTPGSHTYPQPAVEWSYYINPDFTYLAPDTNGVYSDVVADWDLDGQQSVTVDGDSGDNVGPTIAPTSGVVDWFGAPVPTSSNPTPLLHFRVGAGGPFSKNDPAYSTGGGVSFSGPNATGSITHYWPEFLEDGVTSFVAGVAPFDPGGEVADASSLVCYDETADSGYRLRLLFDHTGGSPVGNLRLECMDAGTPTLMRQWTPTVAHTTEYSVLLRVQGTVLVVVLDGGVLATFDVATDTADDTAAIVTDYTGSGLPGLAMYDASEVGLFVAVDRVVIYNGCTGGPENPYPPVTPPPTPNETLRLWVVRHGRYRTVLGPGESVVDPRLFLTAKGRTRRPSALWVVKQGRYRPIESVSLEQFPEPNTTLPPGFDPCEILTPDTNLPPVGDVTPIPAAGGRYFGLCFLPTTLIGDLFNATQRAAGSWSPMEFSQVQARGGVLQLGQGSYKQFISPVTGFYSQALMDAFIVRICSTIGSAILAAQAGGWGGPMIIADDFRVQKLWPTSTATGGGTGSGLSDAELTRISAKWHLQLPGVLLGLRLRPSRLAGPIAGVTVYIAQYDSPNQIPKALNTHVTASDHRTWRDRELDAVEAFGAGYVINLQPNYSGGGWRSTSPVIDMGTYFVGYVMMPDELVECADGWYGDDGGGRSSLIYGSVGYLYTTRPSKLGGVLGPPLLELTGYVDGLAYMRNAIMSLTPL